MKFSLSETDKKQLEELFLIHEDNLYASDILNAYLSNSHEDDGALVNLYKRKGLNEQEAVSRVFGQSINDEEIEDYERISKLYGFDKLTKLNASVYENTPYYKLLKKVNLKQKDVALVHPAYYPYEAFLMDETHIDSDGREVMPLGYFDKSFAFPALTKGKRTWMSLIPHEIRTMALPLEKAHGKVATLGLGLGYFAFMAAEKEDVTSVDIIEFDPNVIALFKEKLLPLFPNKKKINIIKGDAIAFLKNSKARYDYIFADLWHREDDALPLYMALKKIQKEKNLPLDYWIEKSILAYYRRIIITLISEEYSGATDDDYQHSESELDRIINRLHFAIKDKELTSFESIVTLLSENGLKELSSIA